MLLADGFVEHNPWAPGVMAAVVLFIVGTGITLYLRRRDKDSKTFDYRVVSNIAIVTSHKRPERLKVVFGTVEVSNPFISQIRFENTGKQVIQPSDFLDAVTILRPSAKIIDFNIVEESEKNLVRSISQVMPIEKGVQSHEVIEIEPGTMNPGDWFEAQILYDGESDWAPKVSTRVQGQTRKTGVYLTKQDRSYVRSSLVVAAISSVIGIVGTFAAWLTGPSLDAAKVVAALSPLAIGMVGLVATAYFQYRRRRKVVWDRAMGVPKSESS